MKDRLLWKYHIGGEREPTKLHYLLRYILCQLRDPDDYDDQE
jgi:hypothetical protein